MGMIGYSLKYFTVRQRDNMWLFARFLVITVIWWIAFEIPADDLWHPKITTLAFAVVSVFLVSVFGSSLCGSLALFCSRNRILVRPGLSTPPFSVDSPLQSLYFTSLLALAFGCGRLLQSIDRTPDPIGLVAITFGLGTFSGYLVVSRILCRQLMKLK